MPARETLAISLLSLSATLMCVCPPFATASTPQGAPSTAPKQTRPKAALAAQYGKLPLSFEANQGQSDSRVKFLSRGDGYSLYLTDKAAVLALSKAGAPAAAPIQFPLKSKPGLHGAPATSVAAAKTDVVRMELAGANRGLKVTGEDKLPGTANYFIGNDPTKWRSNVPTFAKVRYAGVYPGIDLVYYGNQRQLEYDFVIAPGADPKTVRLRFAGAKSLKLNADGDLTVGGSGGEIAFRKPVVYQVQASQQVGESAVVGPLKPTTGLNGAPETASRREMVEGRFVLLAGKTVGFELGGYDRSKPLIIDPVLTYASYLGGSGISGGNGDSANGIAVDSAGNAYITGITFSPDFPVFSSLTVEQKTNKANANNLSNAFVAKFNPNLDGGSSLVYATYLGGSGNNTAQYSQAGDSGNGIAADSSGNAYVTGQACSKDFPVTATAYQSVNYAYAAQKYFAGCDAFFAKLNPTGSTLLYSSYLGGSGGDYIDQNVNAKYVLGDSGTAIAVDASGIAYIAGYTGSSDFPVTPGVYQSANHSAVNLGTNAFIAKFNATLKGNASLLYSTCLGGNGIPSSTPQVTDAARGIAIDSSGDVYVAGTAYSTNFPVKDGLQSTNKAAANGGSVAFFAEINPELASHEQLLYSTYLGGSGGAYQYSYNYGYPYCTNLEGNGISYCQTAYRFDSGSAVAVDSAGNAYVTGSTYSPDFPVTTGVFQPAEDALANPNAASTSASNAFVAKINPQLSGSGSLIYATYLGGSGVPSTDGVDNAGYGDAGLGIAADAAGDAYVTGYTYSDNFPITDDAFQTSNAGTINVFLTELDPTGATQVYSTYIGGSEQDYGNGIVLDGAGEIFLAGQAYSSNFPLSAAPYQAYNNAHVNQGSNAFIAKFGIGGNTTATLTSSANPQKQGAAVTFTAFVSAGNASQNGIPTGSVVFSIDGAAGSPVALNATGRASITSSSLTPGQHAISVVYSGDVNYDGSVAALTETIAGSAASISVYSGSGQTAVYGSALANPLTVVVRDANEVPVPGVSVAFTGAGLQLSAAAATTNASGFATVTATAVGTGSLGATATAVVGGEPAGATFDESGTKALLTVTANNVNIAAGQPIPALTGYTATGFVNGDGDATLTGAPAESTAATQASAPGTYPIAIAQGTLAAANYSFKFVNGTLTIASTSLIPTTTALAATPNPALLGQTVTFTATVAAASGATPTGSVTFAHGGVAFGPPVPLVAGVATYSTNILAASTSHPITASYSGSATDAASVSPVFNAVTLIPTTTALSASPNPAVLGQTVTFTAKVAAASGTTPTGTVTFAHGGVAFGPPVTLDAGVATYSTNILAASTGHPITASYSGGGVDAASVSPVLNAVTLIPTTTALTVSPNPAKSGQAVTLTATVKASSGTTPEGTVTFLSGSATVGTATLSGGVATLSTAKLPTGSLSLTAVYATNGVDQGSVSSAVAEVIQP